MFTQLCAKGTTMKYLIEWLRDVCSRPGVTNTQYKEIRYCYFHQACAYEEIYADGTRFLGDADLERSKVAMSRSLVCLNALCSHHVDRGSQYYHIVPKNHMSTHLAFDFAPQANPRKTQAYTDEDMVGRTKRIFQRCHGSTVGVKGLLRYCILGGCYMRPWP